jgi:hypothetical protein
MLARTRLEESDDTPDVQGNYRVQLSFPVAASKMRR